MVSTIRGLMIVTKQVYKPLLLGLVGIILAITVFTNGCASTTEEPTHEELYVALYTRLTDMAETPEAKEYVGLLFPAFPFKRLWLSVGISLRDGYYLFHNGPLKHAKDLAMLSGSQGISIITSSTLSTIHLGDQHGL